MATQKFSDQIPQIGLSLTSYEGRELLTRVGESVIQEVVFSILCGGNVRALTESLTQRRLILSNGAMFIAYARALANVDKFNTDPLNIIKNEINTKKSKKENKIFMNWLLGLTGKSIQNVLRSDSGLTLDKHVETLSKTIEDAKKEILKDLGNLEIIAFFNGKDTYFHAEHILHLLFAIGTQTLAIRGSEKSMYGKLFEKLILGSLLTILGFDFIDHKSNDTKANKVFWLSERGDKRESDATALIKPGLGIRFDIGFIGSGNTEISLDKVSRFEREMSYGRQSHFMSTIIIVDKIGDKSRIKDLAKDIDGSIIQMSMTNWVKEICQILYEKTKYIHPILTLNDEDTHFYIKKKVSEINLRNFID